MITLGIICLILGLLLPGVSFLTTLGIILVVIGVVLFLLGSARTGNRRWY